MTTTSDFTRISKIGKGSYGVVYKAKIDDKLFAVKRNLADDTIDFVGCIRELDILLRLNHPNIVILEKIIYDICPHIQRVSSGSGKYTQGLEQTLLSTGDFDNLIFMEASHTVQMSQDRYLGAWRSVNDIQAQAGPQKFEQILQEISSVIKDIEYVEVPYKTRAWTVQKKSNEI